MADKLGNQRVEFLEGTRKDVARKAMYVCSNPDCLRVTGFLTVKGKPRAIAEAAHILPAGAAGPRRDDVVLLPDGSNLERGSEGNAIWLCVACHVRVDNDPDRFPSQLLLEWKRSHEELVSSLVDLDLEQSLLKLGGLRVSHDLARELLMWLDSHRFMYLDQMYEIPRDVLSALEALRHKLVAVRAQVHGSDLLLVETMRDIENGVLAFFNELHGLRIDEIRAVPDDPDFNRFFKALTNIRAAIMKAIEPLAAQEGIDFERIGR